MSINREAERIVEGLTGPDLTAEQLLERMTVRRADGRELSLVEFPVAQALSVGETVRAEEIVLEVPDGEKVTVLVNSTPLRSDDGEVESVVVTFQDMTPLEEIERLRAEFLGMVSHELRTPLTSIRGSATTMLDATSDIDPAEMRQFLRIIVDQADSMRELIGNLLDVARIETGTLPVSPEPADVAVLVDRARNNFISSGGINRLDIDIAPDLPLVVVDRRRIVQVISNLISNAARHSPESSAIRVIAARREFFVEVSVLDEGRGIPADRLPHLFRKFSRVEAEDPGGDTGLGLAICKGIVEAQASMPYIVLQPLGFLLFVICMLAETNRAPFDLPEAESELTGGFHTEYSSMHFAVYSIAEYCSMLTLSAVGATFFLGGWRGPLLPPVLWFLIKVLAFMFFFMWLRASTPRLRYDQLMGFGWKVLLPLSILNVMLTAAAVVFLG